MINMIDYQCNRKKYKNNSLYTHLNKIYSDYKILVGNFGYILINKNTNRNVIKIYFTDNFYKKEYNNYFLLKNTGILLPKILKIDKINYLGSYYKIIHFENIRKFKKSFKSFNKVNLKDLSFLLGKIHAIYFNNGKGLVHGNLHYSNLFINSEYKLGLFDLVSMNVNYLESDFADILYYSNYDLKLLKTIIKQYEYKDILEFKKIYYFTILKIQQNIMYSGSMVNKKLLKQKLKKFISLYKKI